MSRFSIHSDAMSVRSFRKRGSLRETPYNFSSPQKNENRQGGFAVVHEEATNLSSVLPDISDPEVPSRNIFSSDTNDFSNFKSKLMSENKSRQTPGDIVNATNDSNRRTSFLPQNEPDGLRPHLPNIREIQRHKMDMQDIFNASQMDA
jgi:hypothetical protein